VSVNQQELVERAGRGDHDAFAELVSTTIAHLEAVARLILRDNELARDAVQDAYFRAWRSLPGLREADRFDAWLHRLTVNACLDAMRRAGRRPLEVDIEPLELSGAADPMGQVANRDQLERAFHKLPTDLRAVLVLHYYVDLTVPAISEALGIPLGTAQSRLARALASMRTTLSMEDDTSWAYVHRGQIA
jgi:RNA polymerase sigma-70 factor (ECF subfamily)